MRRIPLAASTISLKKRPLVGLFFKEKRHCRDLELAERVHKIAGANFDRALARPVFKYIGYRGALKNFLSNFY